MAQMRVYRCRDCQDKQENQKYRDGERRTETLEENASERQSQRLQTECYQAEDTVYSPL